MVAIFNNDPVKQHLFANQSNLSVSKVYFFHNEMNRLFLLSLITVFNIFPIHGLRISFITWNVGDNKHFDSYTADIVQNLLNLDSPK